MVINTPEKDLPQTCPNCHTTVAAGLKFCETCGTKIELPPTCPSCGALLTVGVKFCETCGKPVETLPGSRTVPQPATEPPAMKQETSMPDPAPVKPVPTVQKKPKVKPGSTLAGVSGNKTLIIAGVVGVIIIAVVALFVVLPMLSSPGASQTMPATSSTGSETSNSGTSSSTQNGQATASASLTTLPTQVPPDNLVITYQADRDPITGVVTVTFTGGQRSAVKDVLIRLTRSDGQIITKTTKPVQVGNMETLQGTANTQGDDRIEVIANYYNGKAYRIVDKIFEFKQRF